MPLLEAMHHRVPIVAYAAAAVPETLGDAGLLLDAKDAYTIATAVHRVVTDAALQAQLIDAGIDRLREFDIAKSRRKLLDALEPVVGAGDGRRDRPPVRPDARTRRGRRAHAGRARRAARRRPHVGDLRVGDRRRVWSDRGAHLVARRAGARRRRSCTRWRSVPSSPTPCSRATNRSSSTTTTSRRCATSRAGNRSPRTAWPGAAGSSASSAARAVLGIADSSYNEHDLDRGRASRAPPSCRSCSTSRRSTSSPRPRRPAPTRSPGCSSAGSRRTRPSTTSSRRSPRTAGSTTPTRACTSSAAAARTATPARSQRFIHALGLDDAVTLTGGVSPAELAAYYRAADVFVVCSEHEGFCVPLLEAMHHGVPIVAYAATAVPETLGDAGLLLDVKDPCTVAAAVDHVVGDAALRDATRRTRAHAASATSTSRAPGPRSSTRSRRRAAAGGTVVKLAVVTPRYGVEVPGRRRDRGPPARDAPRDAPRLHRRGAHHVRARRHDVGRPLPEPARPRSTACACTASRSRAGGRPTSTRAPISSCAAAGASPNDEQREWIDKQGPVAPGLIDAIAQQRRRRRSRSIRTCTTRPSRACPRVADRADPAPGRARRAGPAAPALPRACSTPRPALAYWSEPERQLVEQRFRGRVEARGRRRSRRRRRRGRRRRRARARSVSTTVRTCCVSAASTTARARACSPSASRSYKDRRGGAAAARVRRARSSTSSPAHPDIVVAGAVDEAGEVGPAARRARARVAERVRVVLDRADGGVVGRYARARQQPLRGHPRPRAPFRRRARVRQLRRARGRARSPHRVAARCAPRSGAPGRRYVDGHYRWTDVIDRYATFVRVGRRRAAQPLAGSGRGVRHMYARK